MSYPSPSEHSLPKPAAAAALAVSISRAWRCSATPGSMSSSRLQEPEQLFLHTHLCAPMVSARLEARSIYTVIL